MNYENDCLDSVTGNYRTKQTYSYDNLYQLIKVEGETTYNPYRSSVPEFKSDYSQIFSFDSDGLGNMTSKVSTETVSPQKTIGDNLNYSFNYVYDENFAHRLVRAGDRYYKYDANGNIICEQDGSFESNGDDTVYHKINRESEDVYSTDYGWGLFKEDDSNGGIKGTRYCRTYKWNERNQLISSVDANYNTAYVYGQDGQRSNKYTANSETLYFNKMWTLHTDSGNNVYGGQTSKNIYLGETRIVTKLNSGTNPTYQEEYYKQYYYHSDHLGSASLISDHKGDEYQRIEYTPYGETWVEKTQNTGLEYLPYKFTAKELDEETGLYYYGARYLSPKYSMWISTDPALSAYMSGSDVGGGGIYNHFNLSLYHYANNNPLKYTDPTGMSIDDWQDNGDGTWTVKSKGAKLWDVWGADSYEATGLTEEEARNIHVGDTFGKKKNPTRNTVPSNTNQQIYKENAATVDNILTNPIDTKFGPSKAEIANTFGDISAVLSVANAICFFACPAACPFITGVCFALDAVSAGLYMSEGDGKNAALAMTSVALDSFGLASSIKPVAKMIPSQLRLGYNHGAHRFIQGNGRFIKTAIGKGCYIVENIIVPGGMYIYGKTNGN